MAKTKHMHGTLRRNAEIVVNDGGHKKKVNRSFWQYKRGWTLHAYKELKRRRANNKRAKRARKVNRGR